MRKVILDEFRHRSRNDLQSLVGLTLLKARLSNSAEVKVALKEIANHALALSTIHNHLIHATPGDGQDAMVDMGTFIMGVCFDMEKAHNNMEIRPVSVIVNTVHNLINTERAVHLGLILNHVINETLRNAFPDNRAGYVRVELYQEDEDYILTIQDNGIGVVEDDKFGFRVMQGMVAQLRGHITKANASDFGSEFEVRFPVKAPSRLPKS